MPQLSWHGAPVEFALGTAIATLHQDNKVMRRYVQIARRPVFDFQKSHVFFLRSILHRVNAPWKNLTNLYVYAIVHNTSHQLVTKTTTTAEEIKMRFYRFIGACVVVMAVILFAGASFAAQACVPLPQVAKDLVEAKVTNESLSKLYGDDITKLYLAAAKVDVEKDSDPVGVFFITLPDKIIGNIVEAAGCVKYSFVLPQAAHQAAMNQVASSI